MLDLFFRIIEMPARYIFGRDIFISYSRRDANAYAPNLVLALQTKKPKLSFYLDKWIAPPSGQLPNSLKLQLRLSSILVVICTQNSMQSDFVKEEIRIFSKRRRKIIVVNVDDSFLALKENKLLWDTIGGVSPETEEKNAIDSGQPSGNVIERIIKSVEFTIQDRRLRRSVWFTIAFLAVSISATILYSKFFIKKANAEAARQQEMSTIRKTVAEANFILDQHPDSALKSTRILINLAQQSDSIKEHITEVDVALRNNIGLLPRLLDSRKIKSGDVLSANMQYAAKLTEDTVNKIKIITISQTADGKIISKSVCTACNQLLALSNDGNIIAMSISGDKPFLRIQEAKGTHWDIPPTDKGDLNECTADISPNGKYLAINYLSNSRGETLSDGYSSETIPELWDIHRHKLIASLKTNGSFNISTIAFSVNGKQLVAGGTGISVLRTEIGRALMWTVPDKDILSESDFETSEEFLQPVSIDNLDMSDDARCFVTQSFQSIFIWKRTERNGFRQTGYLPLPSHSRRLRINQGKELFTLSSNNTSPDNLTLSTWDISGYPGIKIGHWHPVKSFAFQSRDSSIITVSDDTSLYDLKFRKWMIKDGHETKMDYNNPIEGLPGFMIAGSYNNKYTLDVSVNKKVVLPVEAGFETLGNPFFSNHGTYMTRIGWWQPDSGLLIVYKKSNTGYYKIKSWLIAMHPLETEIYISESYNYIFAEAGGEKAELFDLFTGQPITPPELKSINRIETWKISDNEKYVAIESEEGEKDGDQSGFHRLYVLDLVARKQIMMLDCEDWISTYAFSPKSNYVIAGDNGGRVVLSDIRKPAITQHINHDYGISVVGFSPDEAYVATGDVNGLARIFETNGLNEITYLMYPGVPEQVQFSNDNKYVAISTSEERYTLPTGDDRYFLFITFVHLKDLAKEASERINAFFPGKDKP